MATSSRHHGHPVRTLVIFAAFIAGLYIIMTATGAWLPKLGLDLRGGTTVTLTAKNTTGTGTVEKASLEQARTIIENRVNSLGVSESEVTTSGTNQIVVTAPNVQQDELVKMVGQTAQLYFRKVFQVEAIGQAAQQQPVDVQPATAPPTDQPATAPATAPAETVPATVPAATATATAPARPLPKLPTPVPSPRPTAAAATPPSFDTLMNWQPTSRDTSDFAAFTNCNASPTPDVPDQPLITCDQSKTVKYLLGPALIGGQELTNAAAVIPSNSVSWIVTLQFNDKGGNEFQTVTTDLAKQQPPQNQFGIVLDGEVMSAPRVSDTISGGRAQIEGSFNQASATQLANILKYGALPLAFDRSSVDTVSAKLGGEQLQAGLIAGAIGLGLVIVYSLIYYRGLAIIVVMSLAISGTLTYALLVLLGQSLGLALNLPGIAGVIVAVGITADSFIIYFERIRDEVREGRSLRTAIETGWARSRKTILAADSVSLLSAVVLFILAIGSVKGFAFTLGLTTLVDIMIVFWFTKPMVTLLGKSKFYGEGHRFSGFEAEHMGMPRPPLHSSRPVLATEGRA